MKSLLLPLLLVLAGHASAGGTAPDDLRLAAAMQRAILVEQDAVRVSALLEEGFDVTQPIGCGSFDSLDAAVSAGNAGLVTLLLRHGARPKPSCFVRAAFLASHDRAVEIVRTFLEAGADVNSEETHPQSAASSRALHCAVWRENVELVALLLSQSGVLLDAPDIDDRTPLMIAVEKDNARLVDMLLRAGADPAARNSQGSTALDLSHAVISRQRALQARIAAIPTPSSP